MPRSGVFGPPRIGMSLDAVGAPRRTRAVSENKIACSTNAALRRGSSAFGKGSEGRGKTCLGHNFESQARELKVACSAVTFRAVGTERAVSSTNTALRRGEVPTPHLGSVKHACGRNLEFSRPKSQNSDQMRRRRAITQRWPLLARYKSSPIAQCLLSLSDG